MDFSSQIFDSIIALKRKLGEYLSTKIVSFEGQQESYFSDFAKFSFAVVSVVAAFLLIMIGEKMYKADPKVREQAQADFERRLRLAREKKAKTIVN